MIIEDLACYLTTVLIRYHDSQKVTKKIVDSLPSSLRKESLKSATNILQDTNYKERLKGLIDNCTIGYQGRRPFLYYILHEITFLKSQLDRKKSFNPSELEEYKTQIIQLFRDLNKLLTIPKNQTWDVQYSTMNSAGESKAPPSISLSGLLNDATFGNKYCQSGILLTEEVFKTLNAIDNSDAANKTLAEIICMEHQIALFVPEQAVERALNQDREAQHQLELHSLTAQKKELEEKLAALTTKNNRQQAQIEAATASNSALLARAELAEKRNAENTKTISELSAKVNQLEQDKRVLEQKVAEEKTKNIEITEPLYPLPGFFTEPRQPIQPTSRIPEPGQTIRPISWSNEVD